MKVLVLGGTGAMGMHLVKILSEKGSEVFVTSRQQSSSGGSVHYLCGNAHDLDFLQPILQERWDAIVDFMVYSTSAFKEREDLLLGATDQYVFLSSARVYAESAEPITEDSPRLLDVSHDEEYLSTDEYALSKARQEDVLRHSGKTNWTIIRPYITYSENRLQLGVLEKEEWLYRALQGRTIVFSSDICSKLTTMTYGLDVAKSMVSLIGDPNAFGQAFHITTENSILWKDVLEIYLNVLESHLGYQPKVLLQDLDRFMKCKRVKYQIICDRLFDRTFDSSKVYGYVNRSEFVDAKKELRVCLERFLENPRFKQVDWISEAVKDRQAKEYTALSEMPSKIQKLNYLFSRHFGASDLIIFLRKCRRVFLMLSGGALGGK